MCCICGQTYEAEDLAHCPAYQDHICSLCCALDARCDDLCKPQARLGEQWNRLLERLLPARAHPYLDAGLGHYLLLLLAALPFLALFVGLFYYQEAQALGPELHTNLRALFLKLGAALLLVYAVVAWWLVLTHKSRQVAQEESNRQTQLLMREIDSHRRTDELLKKAKETAEQANQAKSRYISAISHELRTPLNSILGYAQILDGDPSIPENRRQAVGVIRRGGEHLLSLIEGTLDIARIESGKLTLDKRPLDFPGFLGELVGLFEQQARDKGIRFDYQPAGELPAFVRADPRRLRQILINLLGNAVKFTARGGVTLRVKYQLEMAQFDIQDTGPGIAADELPRVFEPYSRGSAAQTGATGGAGLGLTIARMLTDLMGGELTVESQPGQGSLFRLRLYLPALAAEQAALPRKRRVGYVGVRRRILVVDNEAVDREFLARVLEPLGFQLAQAASGAECLEIAPAFRPHLIFLDLAMPGMDGWETARRLHALGLDDSHLAIISANAFEKNAENDVGIPPEDFITKPVRVDDLLAWIGHKLQLEWVSAEADPAPATAEPASAPWRTPAAADLQELARLVDLGYPRGILDKLTALHQADPALADFCDALRRLARQFQFAPMQEILRAALEDAPPS